MNAVRAAALLTLFFALSASPSLAQDCAEDAAVQGFRIRTVRPDARFARVPGPLEHLLASHRGEVYASDSANTFANEIRRYLREHPDRIESEVGRLQTLSIAVDRWTPCATVVSAMECQAAFGDSRCIDVLVKTISVQLDVYDVSGNRLPIPRSNKMRFFSEIPKPLLAFNPQFTTTYDQRAGLQPAVSLSNDLFAWPGTAGSPSSSGSAAGVTSPTELWLKWHGAKPVNAPFYDTGGSLSVVRKRATKRIDRIGAETAFNASLAPRGNDDDQTRAFEGSANIGVHLYGAAFSRLRLGGGYRWTQHRFAAVDGSLDSLSENAIQASLVADGHVAQGFTRIAAWIDGASPKRGDAYARLAASMGYEKELPVAQNQAVGIEGIAGVGRSVGSLPAYARFYGGSPSPNFLYDSIDSRWLTSMPAGPPIRSAGRGQLGGSIPSGGLIGGESFWHASLNISLPIPRWSFPLIPAETVMTLPGSTKTLKDVLKGQVAGGKELYVQSTVRQMLTPDEQEALRLDANDPLTPADRDRLNRALAASFRAQEEVRRGADRIWQQITPITNFIADEANIYSIKPLLMIDAAHIDFATAADAVTWVGIGGGVQLTVVVARLEAGYLWAVRRVPTDPRGNFVMRLVFRNLF